MSQKLISSFFNTKPRSTTPEPSPTKEKENSTPPKRADDEKVAPVSEDSQSPVKPPRRRRIRQLSDSDSNSSASDKTSTNEQQVKTATKLDKDKGEETPTKKRKTSGSSKKESPVKSDVSTVVKDEHDTKDKEDKPTSSPERDTVSKSKKTEIKNKPGPKAKSEKSKKSVSESAKSKKAASESVKSKKSPAAEKKSGEKSVSDSSNKQSGKSQTNEFDPSKSNYDPVEDAPWKKGEKVPYMAFARTLEVIDGTSSRLKMIEVLRNFLRSVIVLSPHDLVFAVYLCLNKIAPDYAGMELGIGDTLLMRALGEATGRTLDKIKKEVEVKGDLGLVAEASRSNQRTIFAPAPLVLSNVFLKLKTIAQMTGTAVQSKKVDIIKGMMVSCQGCEAKFLIRSLTGKLRIGLAESSLLTALAHAVVLSPPGDGAPPRETGDALKKILDDATLLLKTTYCECPNYDRIVEVILSDGFKALPEKCKLTPGVPLKPMLAHPTKGVQEVLKRFDDAKFTCEFKYDGERAQIHLCEDGRVEIYSRNQENNTTKYPDVISRIPKVVKEGVRDFILDSEAVAWDREQKCILPFQVLSTRKRKDANEADIKVQVCLFAFDLLYLNGESLVKQPLRRRRQLLEESFNFTEGEFLRAIARDTETIEEVQEFLEESVKGNCEGLMVKTLDTDATYEIAKRSHNWLKLKKDYLEGVGDTIDVVVIGGWKGKGKRTGTYGGFLLACYDPESEEFQTLCKIGTGFKEEDLERHSQFFKDHIIPEPRHYYQYDSTLTPDDWFEPVQVWEIKCADLSISPVHKAAVGLVDPEKGISLRFPRFLRIRDDKNVEDATSAEQIAFMYRSQDQVKNQPSGNNADDDFY